MNQSRAAKPIAPFISASYRLGGKKFSKMIISGILSGLDNKDGPMLQGHYERFEYDEAEDAQKTARRYTTAKEFCLVYQTQKTSTSYTHH